MAKIYILAWSIYQVTEKCMSFCLNRIPTAIYKLVLLTLCLALSL